MTDLEKAQDTLSKVTEWVSNQGKAQTERSSPASWVMGLLVAAVAMIGLGIAYWRARKQGKEIAKLKHEKDVAARDKEQADLAHKITKSSVRAAKLRAKGRRAEITIEEVDRKLKEIEENATSTRSQIDALKNWDDVDRYLSSRDNGPS